MASAIQSRIVVQKGNKETYQIMEQVLKAVSLEIVESSQAAKEPLMEHKLPQASVPSMRQLLDLTRYLGHIQLVDHGEPPCPGLNREESYTAALSYWQVATVSLNLAIRTLP